LCPPLQSLLAIDLLSPEHDSKIVRLGIIMGACMAKQSKYAKKKRYP